MNIQSMDDAVRHKFHGCLNGWDIYPECKTFHIWILVTSQFFWKLTWSCGNLRVLVHEVKCWKWDIYSCGVTCDVPMVIYGGNLQMSLELLSKSSWRFTHIFFITVYPITSVSVYHPTFVMGSLSLKATRRFLVVFPPWMYNWISYLQHEFLKLSLWSLV